MDIYKVWHKGFPDLKITHLDLETHANLIIANYSLQGTHLRFFQEISPTGKTVCCPGEIIFCVQGDKVIRHNTYINMLDVYNQLGLRFVPQQPHPATCVTKNKERLIQQIRETLSPMLTKREIELLCLYLLGLTARTIGEIFSISHRTVETHLFRALHRLGCTNKHQCMEKVRVSLMFPLVQDLGNLILGSSST